MGLKGTIDLDSLKNLPNLRTISLMNNNFDGPLPDIGQLGSLKTVYLSNNKFSGVIDSDIFLRTLSLKKVHLAYNQFTGGIPSSLAFLPKLKELRLEGNQFEGLIPNFPQKTWLSFNVSNNALGGHIPLGLSTLDASSFYENQDLCGPPLKPCSLHKFSVFSLVIVVIVVLMALSAICAVIFILSHRRQTSTTEEDPTQPKTEQGEDESLSPRRSLAVSSSATAKRGESTKLVSVRDDREKFDMQDLLRASAEILGSGNFGSSYKAALLSGTVMVVKIFKQMNNVGREEFQQHMRRIGRLRHRNVLPLVAYYYRKEEKLLVSDYVQKGSLAVHLYGGQGGGSLDWRTRLKIIKGVANGLKYLHTELPTVIAAHGHLKPSNVLLNESYEPLLSDYALIPITNQEHAQQLMVAYKSPEYLQHGRITKKTDIWSLGILILEILTGKPPDYGDLVKWVSSKADREEEELNEVFDGELLKAGPTSNAGEEREVLVKLLRIGMECCDVDVEKRLDVKEAADKIEELKEIISTADHHKTSGISTAYNRVDDIDDFYSTCASEMDMRSSRALSDEFLNFNVKLG
ncbi:putative LRR receptor-like serine/threonine-protein kinase RLK [Morus notabilis]|uniref:Putative LRR receptor-like serine/threonine-protein kinase RLK n=1 Tax=Morus notabilis TaxID=981085 RepID=W9RVG1_9ROSA|nr:putative LRR receptor-like serine/threonine-protein kinase RLK [Morus notabilis]